MNDDIARLEIGKRIAECRRDRKLTQEDLANRIGITAQALSQYERGIRYPDLEIMRALCQTLGTSADYLIGLEDKKIMEIDNSEIEDEIWWNLRHSLDQLAIVFGEEFIPYWENSTHVKLLTDLRLRLSKEGTLMPIVKIKDWTQLAPREFIIVAYDNVLYSETILDNQEIKIEYIIQCLETVLRKNYGEILNTDIIKDMVDNMRINHSSIIDGIIPEKIPYGQILFVCKELLKRGDGMVYFPRILEILTELYRQGKIESDMGTVEEIAKLIETANNKWVWLHDKKTKK